MRTTLIVVFVWYLNTLFFAQTAEPKKKEFSHKKAGIMEAALHPYNVVLTKK